MTGQHIQADGSVTPNPAATALRLLNGAGSAGLLFYDLEPALALDLVAHGCTNSGQLVVASFDHRLATLVAEPEHRVRLEVTRNVPRFDIKLTAASIHILANLEWLDSAQVADLAECTELPETLRALLVEHGVYAAELRFSEAILHDPDGATPLTINDLAHQSQHSFTGVFPEIESHDVIQSVPDSKLVEVCQAVIDGQTPGRVCSRCPVQAVCDRIVGKVICADVGPQGVTLTHIGRRELTTVYAQFSEPAKNLVDLRNQIGLLGFKPAS